MRIKLQALTEHIHGFLLILGITAFLSCLIFPSHYLFYFFHMFSFAWFHLSVTCLWPGKNQAFCQLFHYWYCMCHFAVFYWKQLLGEAVLFDSFSSYHANPYSFPSSKNRRLWNCGWKRNWIRWSFWFAKCRLFRVFCSSLFYVRPCCISKR